MTFRIAVGANAVYVGGDIEAGDSTLPVYARAEFGIRPDHEVVHLTGKVVSTVDTWRLDRAQESTTAEAWPVGTPIALVPAGEDPTGETTVNLAHPLTAGASEVDLQGVYRRLKIDAEIVWDASLFGERSGTSGSERTSWRHTVERGREGTTAVAHASGATVTALGPGEG